MTGVMWSSALDVASLRADPDQIGQPRRYPSPVIGQPTMADEDFLTLHLYRMGTRGASIINLSQNVAPMAVNGLLTDTVVFRTLNRWRDAVALALGRLDYEGFHPLLVISAGNGIGSPVVGRDATYGGTNLARQLYPNQVLSVGASTQADTRSPGSNYGSQVDIYAPGEMVAGVALGDAIDATRSGTSHAAPLVTGVAGLLKSFDPRLTASDIKQILLNSATDSIVDASGKHPLLNAKTALRLAAQRTGAPVCGNRVFIKNDSLLTVERRLDDASSDDVIGVWNSGWPVMFVEHGGKSISNGWMTGSNVNFVFQQSQWIRTTGGGNPNNSPFLNSHGGSSHDGDTLLAFVPEPIANRTHIKYFLIDSVGNSLSNTTVTVPLGAPNGAHIQAYDLSRPRAFFYPEADPAKPIFEIDMVLGTYSPLPLNYSLRKVDWLGVSEDGSELRILDRDAALGACYIDFVSLRPTDRGVRRRRIQGSIRWTNGPCAVDGSFAPRVASPLGLHSSARSASLPPNSGAPPSDRRVP